MSAFARPFLFQFLLCSTWAYHRTNVKLITLPQKNDHKVHLRAWGQLSTFPGPALCVFIFSTVKINNTMLHGMLPYSLFLKLPIWEHLVKLLFMSHETKLYHKTGQDFNILGPALSSYLVFSCLLPSNTCSRTGAILQVYWNWLPGEERFFNWTDRFGWYWGSRYNQLPGGLDVILP